MRRFGKRLSLANVAVLVPAASAPTRDCGPSQPAGRPVGKSGNQVCRYGTKYRNRHRLGDPAQHQQRADRSHRLPDWSPVTTNAFSGHHSSQTV